LAAVGYSRKGCWKTDDFEHCLLFSLILYGVSHLGYMSLYSSQFDAQFFALTHYTFLATLSSLLAFS